VLRTAGQLVGKTLPHTIGPRRAGDPAQVVADPSRIMSRLEWRPAHADLEGMLRSAIAWEKSLPAARGAMLKTA
jgi:UDP-glucose 4-epimerase